MCFSMSIVDFTCEGDPLGIVEPVVVDVVQDPLIAQIVSTFVGE